MKRSLWCATDQITPTEYFELPAGTRARFASHCQPDIPLRFSVHRIRRVSRSRLSCRLQNRISFTRRREVVVPPPVLTSHETTAFIGALSSRAFKRIAEGPTLTLSTCLTIKAVYSGERAVLRIEITAGQDLGYCTYRAATRNDARN